MLEQVEIIGTIHWVPDDNLLELRMLREVIGVTWCKFCPNCTISKPENLLRNSSRRKLVEECSGRLDKMKFLQFGNTQPKTFVKNRFIPECMCVQKSECEFRQMVMPYFQKSTSLPQQLFYVEYALSPFTILLNLVVLLTILTSRSLRKAPSFILIANMAFVDLLIGIYSISVAKVNISQIKSILEELMWAGAKLRPSTGPIFIAGQLISVAISLLLTFERFMAIVYCLKPGKRMTRKVTFIALTLAWGIAFAFALLPVFGVAGLHYNIKRACAPLSYDVAFKSESSVVLLTLLTIILVAYFTNLPLYVKIFWFVKNSGSQVGVKREVSLATKIASLIFTNFVFFAIPIMLIFVFSIYAEYDENPFDFGGDAFKSTVFKIIIGQWLPVTCLNLNSLLDPFLYAFRHGQFKRELKDRISKLSGKVLPMNESQSIGNSKTERVTNTRKESTGHTGM